MPCRDPAGLQRTPQRRGKGGRTPERTNVVRRGGGPDPSEYLLSEEVG